MKLVQVMKKKEIKGAPTKTILRSTQKIRYSLDRVNWRHKKERCENMQSITVRIRSLYNLAWRSF